MRGVRKERRQARGWVLVMDVRTDRVTVAT